MPLFTALMCYQGDSQSEAGGCHIPPHTLTHLAG